MNIKMLENHISFSSSIIELVKPFLDQNNLNHFAYAKHLTEVRDIVLIRIQNLLWIIIVINFVNSKI